MGWFGTVRFFSVVVLVRNCTSLMEYNAVLDKPQAQGKSLWRMNRLLHLAKSNSNLVLRCVTVISMSAFSSS
jgi:hypothetical protein